MVTNCPLWADQIKIMEGLNRSAPVEKTKIETEAGTPEGVLSYEEADRNVENATKSLQDRRFHLEELKEEMKDCLKLIEETDSNTGEGAKTIQNQKFRIEEIKDEMSEYEKLIEEASIKQGEAWRARDEIRPRNSSEN